MTESDAGMSRVATASLGSTEETGRDSEFKMKPVIIGVYFLPATLGSLDVSRQRCRAGFTR